MPNSEDVGFKKQMPSLQRFILRCIILMLVVGRSQHHLNSLSESFSPLLIKSLCKGEAAGFPVLTPGSSDVTGVGDDVIFPFQSGGTDGWSAWGLSALIKRLVFRRISWFVPRGQDFSGSECAGCCAGRREDRCLFK